MSTTFQNSKHFPGELIVRTMQGANMSEMTAIPSAYASYNEFAKHFGFEHILLLFNIIKSLTTIIKLHSVVHNSQFFSLSKRTKYVVKTKNCF